MSSPSDFFCVNIRNISETFNLSKTTIKSLIMAIIQDNQALFKLFDTFTC